MNKLLPIFILFLLSSILFADGSQVFNLDLKKDIIIGSSSMSLLLGGHLLRNNSNLKTEPFNWFDEKLEISYNQNLDGATDYMVASTIIALPFLLDNFDIKSTTTIGVMFLEAAFLTYGTKDILKGFISRPRPYNFIDQTPSLLLEDNDRYLSFPSGHTSIAFMNAAFSTYIFSKGSATKTQKMILGISTFSVATTIGISRVLSGVHYPTDVFAGAILGTGIGILVPYLHLNLPEDITLVLNSNTIGFKKLL